MTWSTEASRPTDARAGQLKRLLALMAYSSRMFCEAWEDLLATPFPSPSLPWLSLGLWRDSKEALVGPCAAGRFGRQALPS